MTFHNFQLFFLSEQWPTEGVAVILPDFGWRWKFEWNDGTQGSRRFQKWENNDLLGGGFKYFLFSPLLGEMI